MVELGKVLNARKEEKKMKKIMFNDQYGLTQAVLEGRKTMTRRIIKHPEEVEIGGHKYLQTEKLPFKVGEVVAVAQRYKDIRDIIGDIQDGKSIKSMAGWNNKMFVRVDLMPHQIRITNVRVERLQDICDEDCYREGIYKKTLCPPGDIDYFYHSEPRSKREVYPSAREAFAGLIDKVSGKGTWERNPWVFVYVFELVR